MFLARSIVGCVAGVGLFIAELSRARLQSFILIEPCPRARTTLRRVRSRARRRAGLVRGRVRRFVFKAVVSSYRSNNVSYNTHLKYSEWKEEA